MSIVNSVNGDEMKMCCLRTHVDTVVHRGCYVNFVLVAILCGSDEFVRDFMLLAYKMDMTNGEYVYIVVNQVPSKHVFTPWVAGDDQDETARLAFESVLQVRV